MHKPNKEYTFPSPRGPVQDVLPINLCFGNFEFCEICLFMEYKGGIGEMIENVKSAFEF